MNTFFVTAVSLLLIATELHAQPIAKISRSDLRKDVKMVTDSGVMILRLNDSTPLHRDNFIRLIKSNYYEGISFHRVIAGFVIQAGDGKTKSGFDTTSSLASYTVPAEIRNDLYPTNEECWQLPGWAIMSIPSEKAVAFNFILCREKSSMIERSIL